MLVQTNDPEQPLRCGRLEVCAKGAFARLDGRELALTFTQRLVLARLLERAGKVWTRRDLYESTVGRRFAHGSRAVDQYIAEIRRALGPLRDAVRSIDKVGYRIDPTALSEGER